MKPLSSWKKFTTQVRSGESLLNNWPGCRAIFVSGCQRSGGTMLSEAICQHADVRDASWSHDAELDAAQMLAGRVSFPTPTVPSICLQTTYLNECYREYLEAAGKFQLIWLVRNPNSVIFSMVYNWKRFALNEVFEACGLDYLNAKWRARYERFGNLGVKPIVRAACAYNGKAAQAQELFTELGSSNMVLVEYERLVRNKTETLLELIDFCGLSDATGIGDKINTASLDKASCLRARDAELIQEMCGDWYEKLRLLVQSQQDRPALVSS